MKYNIFITLLIATLITNLPATDQWTSLFNGSSINGWIQRGGKAKYTVETGALLVQQFQKHQIHSFVQKRTMEILF